MGSPRSPERKLRPAFIGLIREHHRLVTLNERNRNMSEPPPGFGEFYFDGRPLPDHGHTRLNPDFRTAPGAEDPQRNKYQEDRANNPENYPE
jgi:hypothetical protein